MKKETKAVFIGNGILLVVGFIMVLAGGDKGELVLEAGIMLLAFFILNVLLGVLLIVVSIFNKSVTPYALAMLMVAGITALCSFTLCSIQPLRL